jgi:hypothetical protein
VCCKSSLFWDLEPSFRTNVPFTGTIKNTVSVLGTIHDCVLYFPKKKIEVDSTKIGVPFGSPIQDLHPRCPSRIFGTHPVRAQCLTILL